MRDRRPGLNHQRLVRLMRESIARCDLRLDGLTVLTEAATGAYVTTPILAAMAGASTVYAVTRGSRYGTVEEVVAETQAVAALAGVADRIQISTQKTRDIVAEADIVTNSGHLRPLDEEMLSWMKPEAVIPLMYESWEYRPEDLDLQVCRNYGLLVGGINERHPAVDVFSFLGIMAVKLLLDAGVAVYNSNILLLCDNPFLSYIEAGLKGSGATVVASNSLLDIRSKVPFDAVVVAMKPCSVSVLSASELQTLALHSPGAVIAQYWGDVDRRKVAEAGFSVWPEVPPPCGHMGVLPAAVGPEATVRLQTAGLKAGEVMHKRLFTTQEAEFVELM
jgi:hypothetical protein